jgi:3-oxoacyl-[acyl-carrier-protein] synthase III
MATIEEKFAKVTGSGHFLPGDPVPPEKIEDYLGAITSGPKKLMRWIGKTKLLMREMLDIEYYHYAIDPETREHTETHTTMGVKAAREALAAANREPREIEFIAVGSPFAMQLPPLSTWVQDQLGIDRCAEITVHSNCTSPYKALMVAHDAIRTGRYKNALVVSTSLTSSALRAEYFNQEALTQEEAYLRWFLSDGAGAVVLESSDTKRDGVFLEAVYIESFNKPSVMGNVSPGYWVNPQVQYEERQHHLFQKMDQITKHVADHEAKRTIFTAGIERMLQKHNIDLSKLKFFQINMPSKQVVDLVLDEAEKFWDVSRDTLYTKISSMGYPGPPACLICLDRILREEDLADDDLILSFVLEVSKFMQAGFVMQRH